jgi:hypothetical protein
MAFTNRYSFHHGEARGHSELAWQIYGERSPQRILPNARTFVNVVQHLRDFGHFEMNKRDLGRQREDRILVAEEEILHEIENSASCKSPESFSVCSLATSSKRRRRSRNSLIRGILNRVRPSWACHELQTMAGILSNFFNV